MISRIKDVLVELGKGFAFVGSEYKLEVGDKEYLQSQLPKAEDIEMHIKDIEE